MSRLIDADALIEDIRKNSASYFADDFAHEWVDRQPTIEERKTGKWIKNIDDDINAWWYECSECGNYPLKNEYGRDDLSMYCPHCGARLLKEGEDNDS